MVVGKENLFSHLSLSINFAKKVTRAVDITYKAGISGKYFTLLYFNPSGY